MCVGGYQCTCRARALLRGKYIRRFRACRSLSPFKAPGLDEVKKRGFAGNGFVLPSSVRPLMRCPRKHVPRRSIRRHCPLPLPFLSPHPITASSSPLPMSRGASACLYPQKGRCTHAVEGRRGTTKCTKQLHKREKKTLQYLSRLILSHHLKRLNRSRVFNQVIKHRARDAQNSILQCERDEYSSIKFEM